MFKGLLIAFLGIAFVGFPVSAQESSMTAVAQQDQDDSTTLVLADALIGAIQDTLTLLNQNSADTGLPQLKKVTVELSTFFQTETSGKIRLYVVTLGGERSSSFTQKITFTLVPPQKRPKRVDALGITPGEYLNALGEAISQIAEAAKRAATREPPLSLDKLEGNVQFAVTAKRGGGLNFQILPVSVELGKKLTSTEIQSLTLSFENP